MAATWAPPEQTTGAVSHPARAGTPARPAATPTTSPYRPKPTSHGAMARTPPAIARPVEQLRTPGGGGEAAVRRTMATTVRAAARRPLEAGWRSGGGLPSAGASGAPAGVVDHVPPGAVVLPPGDFGRDRRERAALVLVGPHVAEERQVTGLDGGVTTPMRPPGSRRPVSRAWISSVPTAAVPSSRTMRAPGSVQPHQGFDVPVAESLLDQGVQRGGVHGPMVPDRRGPLAAAGGPGRRTGRRRRPHGWDGW